MAAAKPSSFSDLIMSEVSSSIIVKLQINNFAPSSISQKSARAHGTSNGQASARIEGTCQSSDIIKHFWKWVAWENEITGEADGYLWSLSGDLRPLGIARSSMELFLSCSCEFPQFLFLLLTFPSRRGSFS
ncbi:hypothetical protein Q3G72_015151 [Acer saccharum]|nr:hypothetical protein Q3G72_015151 [Acer saccharum]